LVKIRGKIWSIIAPEFNTTPDACSKKYKNTNWPLVFSRNNTTETKIVKEVLEKSNKVGFVEEETKAAVEISKQKILEQNSERINKELLNRAAITDLILSKIESSISKVPPINVDKIKYPKATISKTPEEACLMLSDCHLGLACLPEEVGGLGSYNGDIFKERLDNLMNSICKITDIHRSAYPVDTLNIFGLGDLVHGSNDAGQWGFLHTEQTIIDQVFILVNEMTKSLIMLNKKFKNINFYGVFGNHGRVGHKGMEKLYVNWDYVVYKMMEATLSNQKNIKFFISKAPHLEASVLDHKFLLIHGDNVKSWGGLPFYGLARADARFRNMLSSNKNLEGLEEELKDKKIDKKELNKILSAALTYARPFDYLLLGHHHQSAEIESNGNGRILMNSSFIGGDDYTINKLMTSGTASQKFFGMHPEGISWKYDVDLNRK
jgi:hypothetical protein